MLTMKFGRTSSSSRSIEFPIVSQSSQETIYTLNLIKSASTVNSETFVETLQAAGLAWPNLYMWTEAGSYGEQGPVCCPYMGQVHDSQARLRSWNPGGNITSQRSYAPRESEKELPQSDVGTLQTGVDREAPTLNERHQPVGREQIGNLRQSWAPSRPFVPSSRRVSQDTSMPDWPGSKSTTSSRSSSGVGLEIRQKLTGFIEHLSERNLFELAELLGQKADESHAGKAHIGSRRSSTSGAPPLLHPSVPSVVRAASYPGPLSAITRRERCGVPTAQRQPSDVSMKSQFSADSADRLEASQPAMKLPFSKSVKGRKEGFGSTNRAMFGPVATSFSAGASSVVEDKDDEPKLGASLGLRRKRARVSSDRCIETLSQPENTAPNLASMQHVGKTSPQPPAQADYMGRPTRVTFPVPLQQLRNSH
ncbi:MAG: hypothetical protein M4579_004558 [Chaenotheca gracillima]|nr:MAG: hypothetical protein M4579_004558 [Chaenotheca gracillima]